MFDDFFDETNETNEDKNSNGVIFKREIWTNLPAFWGGPIYGGDLKHCVNLAKIDPLSILIQRSVHSQW